MTKLMIALYVAAAITMTIGIGYLRAMAGDPQAVWFFCDLLEICK